MGMSNTLLTRGRGFKPGQLDYLRRVGADLAELGRIKNRAMPAPATDAEIDAIPLPVNDIELSEFYGGGGETVKLVLSHPKNISRFTTRYAKAQQGDGTKLHADVENAVNAALLRHMKDMTGDDRRALDKMRSDGRLNLSPQDQIRHKYAAAYNAKADGAVLDNEFENLGGFAKTIYWNNKSADDRNKLNRLMNAFSSVVPADGGFLIPETLRAELLRVSLESSVVRSRARVIPMETLRVPIPMIDSTTNNGSVYGGMIAYWGEESAALTESQAKFGRIMLEANKLYGFAIVPNELIQDSLMSFVALIDQLWPEALAFFEDLGFIRGSGVGEPYGLLGNPATVAVAKETSQAAATIVFQNVIKMYARMLPTSINRAVWLASPDIFPELATMALNVGTGGSAVWMPDAHGAPQLTLMGRPVVISEKLQTLGTQGDLAFVDLGYYLVGDRQSMSARSSEEYRFANDQTAFRIIQRVTGRPWLQQPLTPANGGNTLSPFVELATRS
jgi:HK97 family phage major capsid protein